MDVLTTLLVNGLYDTVPCVTTSSESFPNFCFIPTSPGLMTAQLLARMTNIGIAKSRGALVFHFERALSLVNILEKPGLQNSRCRNKWKRFFMLSVLLIVIVANIIVILSKIKVNNSILKMLLLLGKFYEMNILFTPSLNDRLFVKNPQNTELGKRIIKEAIQLMAEIGYEQFTFKKLAVAMETTEATIYRYFLNKHKLLIYLVSWYWSYLEFQIVIQLNNISSAEDKIKKIIDILVWEDNLEIDFGGFDHQALYYVAIGEGNKTYLSKDVDENNKDLLYKPFKDLSARIAAVFLEYNPKYKYPNTLASSIIDLSHLQFFFMHHLPRLSDFAKKKNPKELEAFLEHLVFKTLE